MVTSVMILGATSAANITTTLASPLIAAVRIVKHRVLVRIVVDLGLQLLGDGRCGRCR